MQVTDRHPDTLNLINSMGALLMDMGKLGQAMPFFELALHGRRKTLGDRHTRAH